MASLKTKATLFPPKSWTVKLCLVFQSGLKVLATASMFNTRDVRNFAAKICSGYCEVSAKSTLMPSLSDSEKFFHISSIDSISVSLTKIKLHANKSKKKEWIVQEGKEGYKSTTVLLVLTTRGNETCTRARTLFY